MKKILLAWIGRTDLKACENENEIGLGPIGQALISQNYKKAYLISNFPKQDIFNFENWLKKKFEGEISIITKKLTSPTAFDEIYEAATSVIDEVIEIEGKADLTFHLTPGTPAMSAIWILLGKSKYNANLIETSKEEGLKNVNLPFDIAAEFIPTYLAMAGLKLLELSQGKPPADSGFEKIIYRSEIMRRLIYRASKVGLRNVPIFIEGESGTGKELLANAIHKGSPRKDKPFIAVNCGAIPEELVESELFGHKKGAFTGATSDRKGHFETANKGTIFLDEIGELPLKTQVKLLRVLQEGEVTPIGHSTPIKLDVRIIAATNRELQKEVIKGRFREDLFYRLAVAVLKVPPLRERSGDLTLLIDALIEMTNKESEGDPGFVHKKISAGARKVMLSYDWPGNVRELINTIKRAAIWSESPLISEADMKESLLPRFEKGDSGILNRPIENGLNLPDLIGEVANHYLKRAISETNGNKTKAAEILGLGNYQTFSNWMEKYETK